MTDTRTEQKPPLLAACASTKGFTGVWEHLILDHIDFDVRAGEVHTLLGENGAGKTVIANILSGYYAKTGGEVRVNGEVVNLTSPRDGLAHGIAMVHQELMLVPAFTVTQNVMVGLDAPAFSFEIHAVEDKLAALSARYGLQVDPGARVETLSAGEQQRVEILKALYRQAALLLFFPALALFLLALALARGVGPHRVHAQRLLPRGLRRRRRQHDEQSQHKK